MKYFLGIIASVSLPGSFSPLLSQPFVARPEPAAMVAISASLNDGDTLPDNVLEEIRYPVTNLVVDPKTLVATWDSPPDSANYIDYIVYLDDALQGSTILESWDYSPLTYGQAYTASVAARYASGLSEKAYFSFESLYLYPPRNLMDTMQGGFCLSWEPPMMYPALAGSLDGSILRLSGNAKAWAYDVEDNISVTFTLNQPGVLDPLGGPAPGIVSGADIVDGIYYCHAYGGTWMTMDTATGAFTVIGPCLDMTGIAYDFTSGLMYGVTMDGGLYLVDPATGATTFVGADSAVYMDVACDNDGNLYGFDISADVFGSIDKATGAFTAIAPFPFDGGFPQGAGTDHSSNTVYHAAFNASIGAGQLFIADQVTGSYTFVGNFAGNSILDGFAVGASPDSLGGVTPEGLMGYNVYRNGGLLDYIDAPETTWCPDEGIPPGYHSYTVTAVYDLASYGFPGETDESMETEPVFDTIIYCMDLEFLEGWDGGSFDTNNWTPEGAHWVISTQNGHPAPSAEFTWDPIDTNYTFSLESYPICGLGVVEGNIWLDFDLKLEAFNETGEEKMLVQLWDWESQGWTTAAGYDNGQGSFDWKSKHIYIGSSAQDKIFKVRFNATGSNSLDVLAWNLDNIHVYRDCPPPTDLDGDLYYEGYRLEWESPIAGNEWIHWDDGMNYTSIGTGSQVEFDVAARWTTSQLVEYDGTAVTQVAFFPNEASSQYNIRIWLGAGAASMVVDQPVISPVIGEWNYVTLDTPVPIDALEELWVGYYVNTTTGWPAGADDGPAIDGFGNMMNFGGWQTLLQINSELDYNWNIQAFIQTMAGNIVPLVKPGIQVEARDGQVFSLGPVTGKQKKAHEPGLGNVREMIGFNVWKHKNNNEYTLLDFTTETWYLDPGPYSSGFYYWKVQAVYQDEETGDSCSAFSNEELLIVNIPELEDSRSLSVFPNPASQSVTIISTDDMTSVKLISPQGSVLFDQYAASDHIELDVSGFEEGIYLLKAWHKESVQTRKLVIMR